MAREIRVTFQPSGRSVFVLPGTILLEAAARAGFIIETPCGGAGKCGKCLVRVTAGDCPSCEGCEGALTPEQVEKGMRLACQCRVAEDLIVEIPESSLFQTSQKILAHDTGGPLELKPAVHKELVKLDSPDRDDPLSDAERLKEALGSVTVDVSVIRALPDVLREADFHVAATIARDRVIHVEPATATSPCVGIAFDIGTTTLVGTLVDMAAGVDLQVASRINPQTSFGDDVVSRIKRCREDADGLTKLNAAVMDAVNAIVDELARKAKIDASSICAAAFAGNTTMQQILCGINPRSLGEIPFVPAFREGLQLRAGDLGLGIHPFADVVVFPQIGGFVGGDTVAGIVAARMGEMEEPALLIDVGTNGEIVLANRGKLVATSVAAGPAFEGARIVNGMRATSGAIEKVVFDGDLRINVIGNAKPSGICGTGLIDATAALLDSGILDSTGRILDRDEVPEGVSDPIRARIVERDGQNDFMLADASETGTGDALYLYQKDIRELQLANGAIRAGCNILLGLEGLDVGDLGSVLLAGAFGNFIRRKNARRIGMLPSVSTDRIRFVGNTASFGAKRVLLSTRERELAERVVHETRHVDLSLNPEFQMEFSAAMIFPDGDDAG